MTTEGENDVEKIKVRSVENFVNSVGKSTYIESCSMESER